MTVKFTTNDLPSLKAYNTALSKSCKPCQLNPSFYEWLDLNKPEDCFLLFAKVIHHAPLENDPRPQVHRWCKEKWAEMLETGEGDPSETLMGGNYPIRVMQKYLEEFPHSLVKPTKIGEFIAGYWDQIPDAVKLNLENHLRFLIEDLCANLELIAGATEAFKRNNHPLFLFRGQIDWAYLFKQRDRIHYLSWVWYKLEHIEDNIEYFSDQASTTYGMNSYIIDDVFYNLCCEYGTSPFDVCPEVTKEDHNPFIWWSSRDTPLVYHSCYEDTDVEEVKQEFEKRLV